MSTAKLDSIDVADPIVMGGLLIGSMLPFLFSSMAMSAVGRAAMDMIQEVRRQFRTIPELTRALELMHKHGEAEFHTWPQEDQDVFHQAEGKAEYGKCVEISTKAAIKQMVVPGLLAVVSPVLIGFLGGAEAAAPDGELVDVEHAGRDLGQRHAEAATGLRGRFKRVEAGVVDGDTFGVDRSRWFGLGRILGEAVLNQSATGETVREDRGLFHEWFWIWFGVESEWPQ
jgi:K(+)-stimulated pyrophosphate-energized sodium pump